MTESNTNRSLGSIISSLITALFWFGLLTLFVLKFVVYQQVTVVGKSMTPNYDDGQLLLVNQLDKQIHRGQVVAVYEDTEVAKTADYFTRFSARFFLKRVIGLPGEEIEIIGSKIIIYNQQNPQGAVLKEDYISDRVEAEEERSKSYFPKTKIPQNCYFVLGDNRSNSTDSRLKGCFPDYAIFGQESLRIWPIRYAEIFDLPNYSYTSIDNSLELKRQSYRESMESESLRDFNSMQL